MSKVADLAYDIECLYIDGMSAKKIAKELGWSSGVLTFFLGDAHIYLNHLQQVNTTLARSVYEAPWLFIHPEATLLDFLPSQVELKDYKYHDAIPAPLNTGTFAKVVYKIT